MPKLVSIDPALVEELTGEGFSVGELADYFGVSREYFYKRDGMKEAVARGLAANQNRKLRLVEPVAESDVGRQLSLLLFEICNDLEELRGQIKAA